MFQWFYIWKITGWYELRQHLIQDYLFDFPIYVDLILLDPGVAAPIMVGPYLAASIVVGPVSVGAVLVGPISEGLISGYLRGGCR